MPLVTQPDNIRLLRRLFGLILLTTCQVTLHILDSKGMWLSIPKTLFGKHKVIHIGQLYFEAVNILAMIENITFSKRKYSCHERSDWFEIVDDFVCFFSLSFNFCPSTLDLIILSKVWPNCHALYYLLWMFFGVHACFILSDWVLLLTCIMFENRPRMTFQSCFMWL